MKHEIEIPDGVIPEGYEPVAFRNPTKDEDSISLTGKLIRTNCEIGEPRLVLRKKWQWPEWLDADWLEWGGKYWRARTENDAWYIEWGMTNHPEPPDRSRVYHRIRIFTFPSRIRKSAKERERR